MSEKWICICSQTIVTYVGQVTCRELLIINQQSATFQLAYLLRQTKRAFGVVHLKTRRPPRVRWSTGSVGGHIEYKFSPIFWIIQKFFGKNVLRRLNKQVRN